MKIEIHTEAQAAEGDNATRRDEQHLGCLAILGEMGASRDVIDAVIRAYDAECINAAVCADCDA